jgi:hypothetical protein
VEMRIVVADATSAGALAERLTVAFGANRISRWADPPEVGVQCGRQADRTVLRVLKVVEGWLDQAGAGFADMQLGERSYRIARWAPVESWQPASGIRSGSPGHARQEPQASLTEVSSSSVGRERR